MKVGAAIAEIMKREGIEILCAYPVNHLIEYRGRRSTSARSSCARSASACTWPTRSRASPRATRSARSACSTARAPRTPMAASRRPTRESVPILVIPRRLSAPHRAGRRQLQRHARNARHRQDRRAGDDRRTRVANVMRRAFSHICATAAAARRSSRCRPICGTRKSPSRSTTSRWCARKYGARSGGVRKAAAKLLAKAKRPVIYAGQGVHWAKAWPQLRAARRAAGRIRSPPASKARARFPENHPLSLGSGGVAVPKPVRHFLDHADVIFGIGCSFTETDFGVRCPKGKTYHPRHARSRSI